MTAPSVGLSFGFAASTAWGLEERRRNEEAAALGEPTADDFSQNTAKHEVRGELRSWRWQVGLSGGEGEQLNSLSKEQVGKQSESSACSAASPFPHMAGEIDNWGPTAVAWIPIRAELVKVQEFLPLTDVLFLHMLHIHLQDLRAVSEGTAGWEELAADLRRRIRELRQTATLCPEAVSGLVESICAAAAAKLGREISGEDGKNGRDQMSVDGMSSRGGREVPSLGPRLGMLARQRYVTAMGTACAMLEELLSPRIAPCGVDYTLADTVGHGLGRAVSMEDEEVFFMTNRTVEGRTEKEGERFGQEVSSDLYMGTSQIKCYRGKLAVNQEMQRTERLPSDEFKNALRLQIEQSETGAVVLYIHGCFTDFPRGVGYGAQIKRGVEHRGPMVVFSWPTGGRPTLLDGLRMRVVDMYRKDEQRCVASASHLRDVLRLLSTEVGAKSIHVIAYSMGARSLIEAMHMLDPDDLSSENGVTTRLYFMAPDVDVDLFSNVVCRFRFRPAANRRTPAAIDAVNDEEAQSLPPVAMAAAETAAQQSGAISNNTVLEAESVTTGTEEMAASQRSRVSGLGKVREDRYAAGSAEGESTKVDNGGSLEHHDGREQGRGEDKRLVDLSLQAFIDGDLQVALRLARAAVEEGWQKRMAQFRTMFGRDDGAIVHTDAHGAMPARNRNAMMTLYAAENDHALVIAEMIDQGSNIIRAGRKTNDFLLCHNSFETIDATELSSILTSGHFYLFHDIVRADLGHMMAGRSGTPWWRQERRWHIYDYWKLSPHAQPISLWASHPASLSRGRAPLAASPLAGFGVDDILVAKVAPLFWASP